MSEILPKPFASAHRGGNSRAAAMQAIEAGADLLEADIWLHKGKLELRHDPRLGPLPILWRKWSLSLLFPQRYTLGELIADTPDDIMLFLDFKGDNMALGPTLLRELNALAPHRVVSICGRNYPQLQTIADEPNIICFYSVGDESEWPAAKDLISRSKHPALSIDATLATPERMEWMTSIGGVVVCWNVTSEAQMQELRALGVDGFTTDHDDLLTKIRELRAQLSD